VRIAFDVKMPDKCPGFLCRNSFKITEIRQVLKDRCQIHAHAETIPLIFATRNLSAYAWQPDDRTEMPEYAFDIFNRNDLPEMDFFQMPCNEGIDDEVIDPGKASFPYVGALNINPQGTVKTIEK
jgi:hypothetical protein